MRDRPGQSSLAKILLVGWREFRHTALTKGFILGAIGVPILMFGLMALVPLLASRESAPLVGTIVVADPSGTILPRAKAILAEPPPVEEVADEIRSASREGTGNPAATVDAMSRLSDLAPQTVDVEWRAADSLDAVDAIKADVRAGRVLAGVIVTEASLDPTADAKPVELLIPSSLSPTHIRHIARSIRRAAEEERIARSGIEAAVIERLASVPEPATTRISPEGAEAEERTEIRMIVPLAFMLLLWISIFTSANYLLTTTIEEKSNKVMEVLLAAVSPMQLLCGKIAGYSLVSLVMLVMYGGLGLAGLAAAAMLDLVDPLDLAYLVIYFAMAYVMVSAMMAAVGSAVSDLREAQSLVTPVMLVLIVPLLLWAPIIENPNGILAIATSFIPPASPFVMILRLTATTEPIPIWQTVLSVVWGFACTWGMLWLAARIFRVGVLMQGKAPTPKELVRWAFVK